MTANGRNPAGTAAAVFTYIRAVGRSLDDWMFTKLATDTSVHDSASNRYWLSVSPIGVPAPGGGVMGLVYLISRAAHLIIDGGWRLDIKQDGRGLVWSSDGLERLHRREAQKAMQVIALDIAHEGLNSRRATELWRAMADRLSERSAQPRATDRRAPRT